MVNSGRKTKKIALVGSPNVGKSAIFNCLTGSYVTVSNYPGTTVDIARGVLKLNGEKYEIIDTPGMYSLTPLTDEERASRRLLETERPDLVIHVVDAKNIRRMLNLTFELQEAGFDVVLNLNIMDEAKKNGVYIDLEQLSCRLGIPVAATSAARRKGISHLKKIIGEHMCIQATREIPSGGGPVKKRDYFRLKDEFQYKETIERYARIDETLNGTFIRKKRTEGKKERFLNWLGEITRKPLTGIPILIIILYLGLYQVVGKFAAGYLVDYLNNVIFGEYINPVVHAAVENYLPWELAASFIIGEYGVFTLGVRYALAIILPIAGTFFFVFAILEDSGYLPRLAMLGDCLFKKMGLNGRAVIPITLGLGCGTMAVMVSRTLETRRERRLAVFLLSLTIPCSAQLGIVLALLSHNPSMVIVWAGYILTVFFAFGWLSNKILPGTRGSFYMEIPPLRVPFATNLLKKAYSRMLWYFMEILPIFIATSILLCAGAKFGLLERLIHLVSPCLYVLGLPPEGAQAFILGFFRRDYGAAGLYDLALAGRLSDEQLLVASVALTLFVPCVAQLAVMVKEEGKMAAAVITGLVLIIAFWAAFLMNLFLR